MDDLRSILNMRAAKFKTIDLPDAENLARFMESQLSEEERNKFIQHAADNPDWIAAIGEAERLRGNFNLFEKKFPSKWKQDLKKKIIQNGFQHNRFRYAWFIAFVCFMSLSFVWPRYFLQMLTLAIVCAIKWLLETRARHLHINVVHQQEVQDAHIRRSEVSDSSKKRV